MSAEAELATLVSLWIARHGGESVLDLRAGRALSVPGLARIEPSETATADWVLVDHADEPSLRSAAAHAARGLVCVIPNASCLAARAGERDLSLGALAPAFWRVGRVRETALFDRPWAGHGMNRLPIPPMLDRKIARQRAVAIDTSPRSPQARRRHLARAGG